MNGKIETKWLVMYLLSLATVSNQGNCVTKHVHHDACYNMFLDK